MSVILLILHKSHKYNNRFANKMGRICIYSISLFFNLKPLDSKLCRSVRAHETQIARRQFSFNLGPTGGIFYEIFLGPVFFLLFSKLSILHLLITYCNSLHLFHFTTLYKTLISFIYSSGFDF